MFRFQEQRLYPFQETWIGHYSSNSASPRLHYLLASHAVDDQQYAAGPNMLYDQLDIQADHLETSFLERC